MALDYLGIARHFTHGPAPDVAVAQLTPPDADGWCSPGLSCDFLPLVWRRACTCTRQALMRRRPALVAAS